MNTKNVTISELSEMELKAAAFDNNEQIKNLQGGLKAIYDELLRRQTKTPQELPIEEADEPTEENLK